MSDNPVGPSQNGSAPAPTESGANPAQTQFSDLARTRAQQRGASPTVGQDTDSGKSAPSTQDSQRSEYIPRERFDEVNTARIRAETQLAMYQQQQQLTQQQAQRAAQANQGINPAQYAGAQAAQSAPVQDFLSTISSKEEQEKWRQKILNQPVTGIAELIQHAIRTEGSALLQSELAKVQASVAPLQQFFMQQQGSALEQYANKRAADPSSGWAQIQPTFNSLAREAYNRGYTLNAQSLEVIEAVARAQAGVPLYQHNAPAAPFTERPGGQGLANQHQQPPAQLSDEQRKFARMFGMDESKYASDYETFRSRR